ncbi:hypothetical protein GTR04_1217 [Trichophyton interdigitale]|uniref:Uncharacterized protein n=2 Tax=Trichophyton interdigitale TaxID=101480 RepID=A0A9P4YL51_9EURO|nr:hypothetical protein GY631_1994 [Trichophyton interdigitale]KAF3900476.1 hypothetical protein GY632_0733 [Trichophyton interdigitale]KAG8211378.1 hypothetical protein GTR04_1217 [Trichophyton interdigitale]KDB25462.1 hypothetical protein H109_02707 [Trichophyton interdigitale MR816]
MDNDLMTYLPELQEALQDVYSEMGYTEMWGVDLAKGDKKEPRRSNNFERHYIVWIKVDEEVITRQFEA